MIGIITERRGLGKTSWGDESVAKRSVKQLVAGVAGITGLIIGGFAVFAGIALILSLVGIILGLILLFGGASFVGGPWKLIHWAFNKEEWDRRNPVRPNQSEVSEPGVENLTTRLSEILRSIFELSRRLASNNLWVYLTLLCCFLWLSTWMLIDSETAFGIALFTGRILLPIAIFFDIRDVKLQTDWKPHWWVYVGTSVIPMVAPIFGFVWLARKKQKTGFVLLKHTK